MGRIACLGTVMLLGLAGAGERDGAKKAFLALQEAARRPESDAFRGSFTRDALRGAETDAALRELAGQLVDAKLEGVREEGDEAAVAFRQGAEERELALVREGDEWRAASLASHVVAGPDLERRRGRKPAIVRLEMRTENTSYGASAYSFAHVTGDPEQCKNRMDVWFCHNGDFHPSGGGRMADLGKKPLAKLRGLPVGAEWSRTCPAEKGHTYVVHCRSRSDFYAAFRVRKVKRGVVEIEWTLLADGPNAPDDIHTVRPLVSDDGADGCDGLCGKNG